MARSAPSYTPIRNYFIGFFLSALILFADIRFDSFASIKGFFRASSLYLQLVSNVPLDQLNKITSTFSEKIAITQENNYLKQEIIKLQTKAMIEQKMFSRQIDRINSYENKLNTLGMKSISLFEIASIDLKNYLCCSSHRLFLNNPDKKLIGSNLPVMAKESYVGQTRKNYMNFIEVILFSDAEHLLPIKSSSFFCNARGRGKPLMISCVVNTEESALTNINDSIFTSGLGGVFMPNIKVGEIIETNSLSIDESEVIIKLIDDPLEQNLFGIVR